MRLSRGRVVGRQMLTPPGDFTSNNNYPTFWNYCKCFRDVIETLPLMAFKIQGVCIKGCRSLECWNALSDCYVIFSKTNSCIFCFVMFYESVKPFLQLLWKNTNALVMLWFTYARNMNSLLKPAWKYLIIWFNFWYWFSRKIKF